MSRRFLIALCVLSACLVPDFVLSAKGQNRVPVLVELFTSEGCSSCPPADVFLQKLDEQPVAGTEFVVLSEHVDYWNHDGWTDPYSSAELTQRQQTYSSRLHLNSPYTPQMVVDGCKQFTGSNVQDAQKAFEEALHQSKIPVRISGVAVEKDRVVAHLETDPLSSSLGLKSADVYVAVALNHAESQVLRGENANHRLTHTAVVRKLVKVGKVASGEQFVRDVQLKVDTGSDPRNVRVVAFLQDPNSGKTVGAATKAAGDNPSHGN